MGRGGSVDRHSRSMWFKLGRRTSIAGLNPDELGLGYRRMRKITQSSGCLQAYRRADL